MNYDQKALKLHKELKGKLEVNSKQKVTDDEILSTVYTPGVAAPCLEIAKDKEEVYNLTGKGNTIAIVTDGSAVLGLGNIGAEAALPVMEGKAVLFKEFADVNAVPICLDTQDTEKIIQSVVSIAPAFGGINLEDISAPRCFEIERVLNEKLNIPVFHDDQHGTAVVVSAALLNALKLAGKDIEKIKVVISGAGSAGTAIAKMLSSLGVEDIIVLNSKGILREEDTRLDEERRQLAAATNPRGITGGLKEALEGADVFIGVSAAGILAPEWIKEMNEKPIIFAMANPVPEIEPALALESGAYIVGTGRSDYPNQINNVLAFPGIFRGALEARASDITEEMKLAAAKALANTLSDEELREDYILPKAFDERVSREVAEAVRLAWEPKKGNYE